MTTVIENLAYAAAFACLVFTGHLLSARPAVATPTRLLGANFLLYTIQSLLLGARFGGWLPDFLLPLRPLLAMILGLLLFLYFEAAADPSFRLRVYHCLHLTPAIVLAAEFASGRFPLPVDLAISASFAGYAAALALKSRSGSAHFSHLGAQGAGIAARVLVAGAAALAIAFLSEVAIHLDVAGGAPLARSPALLATMLGDLVLIGSAILAALSRPSPLEWMYAFGSRRELLLSESERVALGNAFDQLVMADKVWLEEGTTLAAVAARLGVPPRGIELC